MTNYWEELDKVTFQLRSAYLAEVMKGNWVNAAHRLFVRNLAAPPEARVESLEAFTPPRRDPFANGLEKQAYPYLVREKAMDYCYENEPLIEAKMAEYRASNMAELNRI